MSNPLPFPGLYWVYYSSVFFNELWTSSFLNSSFHFIPSIGLHNHITACALATSWCMIDRWGFQIYFDFRSFHFLYVCFGQNVSDVYTMQHSKLASFVGFMLSLPIIKNVFQNAVCIRGAHFTAEVSTDSRLSRTTTDEISHNKSFLYNRLDVQWYFIEKCQLFTTV